MAANIEGKKLLQYQDRDKPTVSFNLSTFEIHIEFHSEDANHFHMVLVNGASQIAFRFINAQEIAKVAKVSDDLTDK